MRNNCCDLYDRARAYTNARRCFVVVVILILAAKSRTRLPLKDPSTFVLRRSTSADRRSTLDGLKSQPAVSPGGAPRRVSPSPTWHYMAFQSAQVPILPTNIADKYCVSMVHHLLVKPQPSHPCNRCPKCRSFRNTRTRQTLACWLVFLFYHIVTTRAHFTLLLPSCANRAIKFSSTNVKYAIIDIFDTIVASASHFMANFSNIF